MPKRQLTVTELELEIKRYVHDRSESRAQSARSVALRIGMNPSTLQKILRGERRLGVRLAREIAVRLDLEITKTRSKTSRTKRFWTKTFDGASDVQMNWLHLAILETLKLSDFQPKSGWIAKRLGLPDSIIEQAVEKLIADKLLARTPDGKWIDLLGDASSGAEGYQTTDQFRKTQKELLSLSTKMLDRIPYEKREHGFSILPISARQLPQLKQKIQKFHWDLCEMAQNATSPKDNIYAIEIGFFPVTEGE